MFFPWRRSAAGLSSGATLRLRVSFLSLLLPVAAHAVVVRGRLTDPLGQPIAGGKVQLVQNGKVSGVAFSGPDGSYEIRSSDSGRFRLLGFGPGYLPAVGAVFYGGLNDVLERDVVVSAESIHQEVSVTATGLPTPLPQLTAPVTVIDAADLATRVGIVEELRLTPGAFLVQTGQYGAVTSLFLRGGPSDGNKVLIDGIPAEDVGGSFDFGTVSSTGIASIETYRGPNSALYGADSQSSVVSLTTPRGTTRVPVFNYTGDAGTLHEWRNEATVSGTARKLDYLAGGSFLEASNAEPRDEYRSATEVANLGYAFNGATSLRAVVRNADSTEGVPGARDFYGRSQPNVEADQDLYANATLENRTRGDWHNLLRYGVARKREQERNYGVDGTLETYASPYGGTYTAPFGDLVTIRGANGTTGTDRAQIFAGTPYDQANNRDELYYQTDYVFPYRIAVLFGFRYDDERAAFNEGGSYPLSERTQRTNFEYNLQIQGDIKSRLFYSLGGSLEKNHLYGIVGEPRLGLAYVPVRERSGWLHGTKLRVNVATGVQEPSLSEEFYSLRQTLLNDGFPAQANLFAPIGPERSRTLDVGIDQNIAGQKLVLKAGFFHNQFSHQIEYVDSYDINLVEGNKVAGITDPNFYGAEVNSLAYRAVGAESELDWQPLSHLLVRAGYTFLGTRVSQSFSDDESSLLGGFPYTNPNYPTIAIGSSSPLVGGRVFRRPPHTGFFAAEYTTAKWTVALKGAYASRSDDSTFLGGYSPGFGYTLLLPNRDLDFGYTKMDLGSTYQFTSKAGVFVQLDNLLNDQHIGPIGYPGLPFTARAGVKLRLGGE